MVGAGDHGVHVMVGAGDHGAHVMVMVVCM